MENQTNEIEKLKKESSYQDITSLIKKTDKENPKPEDLAEMQRYLDDNSALVVANSISRKALERAVEICSTSALVRELYNRQIKEKQNELGIKTASPIEKILIEQVVICWLRLNHFEMIYSNKTAESHTFTSGIYWDKKLSSAQRRLLKACESLAKVKKLTAEADLKEQQARNKRGQGAILANQLLKDLTN